MPRSEPKKTVSKLRILLMAVGGGAILVPLINYMMVSGSIGIGDFFAIGVGALLVVLAAIAK